jgi:Ca2+-transporting ATPase
MTEYYAMRSEQVMTELHSSEKGLSAQEADARLKQYGPNELPKGDKITIWHIFFSQFADALIILLIFAGILALLSGEFVEAGAIFFMLFLNALMGTFQEYKAEQSMEALEKVAAPYAKVLRDGVEQKIPAKNLVPGDIISLEAGDIIPADSRLISCDSLQVQEASLTGESVPSEKSLLACKAGVRVPDQKSMVFSGTNVTYGKARAVVIGTGKSTEFGKIASSIQQTKEEPTPLQRKFEQMAKQIGIVVIILVILVMLIGWWRASGAVDYKMLFFFALALTVSVIPESLPVMVTVGLSTGANRLSRKNMLIKKLAAAESLGAATVICTDKTGTLTKNQMTVTDIYSDGKTIKVSGSGYDLIGDFTLDGKPYDAKKIDLLLRIGVVCNDAKISEGRLDASGAKRNEIIGDPTEGSLLVVNRKRHVQESTLITKYSAVQQLPFDSDRKCMSVIVKDGKKLFSYTKGAPDLLLKKCDRYLENGKVKKLTQKDRERILQANFEYAQNALRVLGFAYSDVPALKSKTQKYTIAQVEKNLIFVGLMGMIDPAREEVLDAVNKCHGAGIKVIMITGDHAVTAKAIAQKIGLWQQDSIILTGEELENMSDAELQSKINQVSIVARALPIQKVRIVDALKAHGHIVAMTGDGVNDAPALKRADIGIAMGSGTDVAKEVAKATLVDDNFSSIVNAIEEGRNIYDKILKSARYLLSCNAGELTAAFIALVMALPFPLLPLQLLLMNLLTDDFPSLGLGMEAADEGIMQRPPRDPKEKPVNLEMLISIVMFGIVMGVGAIFVFLQYKDIDLQHAQTMAFCTLVMIQMFAVMSSRSMYPSLKKLNPFTNLRLLAAVMLSITIQLIVIYWDVMQKIFETVPLTGADWIEIIEISFVCFLIMEASKFFLWLLSRKRAEKKTF